MIWKTKIRTFDLSRRALIMGVVNVTADSFSDGGQFADPGRAVAHALQLAADGAEVIDIGGESTRPGAEPVSETEEMNRVIPVIEALAEIGDRSSEFGEQHRTRSPISDLPFPRFAISIDTMKPGVARAALAAGAEIVNDVTGLRDSAMREVVRASGAGAIAMHMQGTPCDMQLAPAYGDVTAEVREFFRQSFDACLRSAIDPMRLAYDPGIGFGKTLAHNLALIRNLDSLRVGGRPLVLGVSRKSFIGGALGATAMEDRAWPTVALTSYGLSRGASVFRVHDALPNGQALRMTEAILRPEAVA
jgi:dihydropteroate synthase